MFRPPRIRMWTQVKSSLAISRGRSHSPYSPALRYLPSLSIIWMFFAGLLGCSAQEAFFCPDDGCADKLIQEINAATVSCHVAIAYFNHDDIAQALIDAVNRGVDVQVIGEKDEDTAATSTGSAGINYEVVTRLKKAGVPYRDDGNPYLMHNKFTIIDGRTVLTGSFNYTYAADTKNSENLVILTSQHMAEVFEADFQELWAGGSE